MPARRPQWRYDIVEGGSTKVHVVVVGCGRVGSELAGALELGGHTVAVVDKRKEAFRRLPPSFSGKTIVGFGFDRDTLLEAQVDQAGAFAAVTSGDNSNIMAARVARETFEIERVVARIYDPRRAAIYQRLGIPTVATVAWTTDQVLRRLLPGDHAASWTDSSGSVVLIERDLPATWAGRQLSQLEAPGRCKLVSITRLGSARIFDGELVGQEGDILHLILAAGALEELQERLDEKPETGGHH